MNESSTGVSSFAFFVWGCWLGSFSKRAAITFRSSRRANKEEKMKAVQVPMDPSELSDETRHAIIAKMMDARERLPQGWRKGKEGTKEAPFVHEDGRVSWKHPARDAVLQVYADELKKHQRETTVTSPSAQQRSVVKRLRMMLKSGVPVGAVTQRAKIEGVDMNLVLAEGEPQSQPQPPRKRVKQNRRDPLIKYQSMLKAGIPYGAVKQRAKIDGYDLDAVLAGENAEDAKENVKPLVNMKKYERMLKAGVPKEAVKQAAAIDGVSFEDLNHLLEDESSELFHPIEGTNLVELKNGTILANLVTKMAHTISKRGTATSNLKIDTDVLYHALGSLRGVQRSRCNYNRCGALPAKRKPFLELMTGLGMPVPSNPKESVDIDGLDSLVAFIERKYKDELATIASNLEVGMYHFDSLAEIYKPGTLVVAKGVVAGGVDVLCEVIWNRYEQGRTMFGVSKDFKVSFQFVVAVGKHFTLCDFVEGIGSFEGRRNLKNLMFVPLSAYSKQQADNMLAGYRNRGTLYSTCAVKPTYLGYAKGSFYAKHIGGKSLGVDAAAALHMSGRAMVDTQAAYEAGHTLGMGYEPMVMGIKMKHKEYQLMMRNIKDHQDYTEGDMPLFDSVPDEYLAMTWPAVVGFSFTSRAWGEILVDGLGQCGFRENVFDELVLSPSRKRLLKALVKNGNSGFNDLVSGKGEGSVFLLYGKPGVGKTLTAEAIAEMLHKPLYMVSVGQLGSTAAELETNLARVLNLCGRWDALILLDEVDILIEKRTSSGSIERNAMVSVMLRLVEYFRGVLFLTSNRVDSLDPAFKTRISLALRYDSLDRSARKQVWINLLRASGYEHATKSGELDVEALAEFDLNGREIKNAIRLGMALAQEDGKPLSLHLLMEALSTLNEFHKEMEEADAY